MKSSKPVKDSYEPQYKRKLSLKDGKLVMGDTPYVKVPKDFANEVVKFMKSNVIWEEIVTLDGEDYMRSDRFKVYEGLSKVLNK